MWDFKKKNLTSQMPPTSSSVAAGCAIPSFSSWQLKFDILSHIMYAYQYYAKNKNKSSRIYGEYIMWDPFLECHPSTQCDCWFNFILDMSCNYLSTNNFTQTQVICNNSGNSRQAKSRFKKGREKRTRKSRREEAEEKFIYICAVQCMKKA